MTEFAENAKATAPVVECRGVQRIYQQDSVPVCMRYAEQT